MFSQIIGSNTLALFLQHDELDEMGICQPSTEVKEVRKLVVDTLRNLGVEADGDMEIEMFNGKQGVLVFAVLGLESMTRYIKFDDLEDLIDAVGVLNVLPAKSKLTYCRGKYWLEIKDYNEILERVLLQLREFGHQVRSTDYKKGVLEEYGTLIEEQNALAKFKNAFYSLPL